MVHSQFMSGMTPTQQVAVLIPAAYLVGSIPFGLLVGRMKGIDPRRAGSGNIGATNVGRLLGKKFFALVFLLDRRGRHPDLGEVTLRQLVATWAVHDLDHLSQVYASLAASHDEAVGPWKASLGILLRLVGFAAILGHVFSVFLGFKGGKGVATSSGVILGLTPYFTIPGMVALAVWAIVLKGTRYISVASVVAAISFPVAYLLIALVLGWPLFREQLPLLVFSALVAAMIVYKHRSNLVRLRAGTEPRYDERAASAA